MNHIKSSAVALSTVPEIESVKCRGCLIPFERLRTSRHLVFCRTCWGWMEAYVAQESVSRALRRARSGRRHVRL